MLANGNTPASSQMTRELDDGSTAPLGLRGDGLPAAFAAANKRATRAQRRFLNLQRAQIVIPLLAVAVGLVATLNTHLGYLGVLATASAAAVATLRLVQRASHVETEWYEARAAAEEIKSLAWRYAVRAAPFDQDDDQGAADELLAGRVSELVTVLPEGATPPDHEAKLVTVPMRALRAADQLTRRQVYRDERLYEQLAWYRARSATNRRWGVRFDIGLFVSTAITVAAGVSLVVDSGDSDVLGPIVGFAAGSSGAVVAWSGVRRFASLSAAYHSVETELEQVDAHADAEGDAAAWSAFVVSVEDVLAREHLQWRAARR